MKIQLNLPLVFLAMSFIVFTGCKKSDDITTTIKVTNLENIETGVLIATFTATGILNSQ